MPTPRSRKRGIVGRQEHAGSVTAPIGAHASEADTAGSVDRDMQGNPGRAIQYSPVGPFRSVPTRPFLEDSQPRSHRPGDFGLMLAYLEAAHHRCSIPRTRILVHGCSLSW
jgi:hypothetical protein